MKKSSLGCLALHIYYIVVLVLLVYNLLYSHFYMRGFNATDEIEHCSKLEFKKQSFFMISTYLWQWHMSQRKQLFWRSLTISIKVVYLTGEGNWKFTAFSSFLSNFENFSNFFSAFIGAKHFFQKVLKNGLVSPIFFFYFLGGVRPQSNKNHFFLKPSLIHNG